MRPQRGSRGDEEPSGGASAKKFSSVPKFGRESRLTMQSNGLMNAFITKQNVVLSP